MIKDALKEEPEIKPSLKLRLLNGSKTFCLVFSIMMLVLNIYVAIVSLVIAVILAAEYAGEEYEIMQLANKMRNKI